MGIKDIIDGLLANDADVNSANSRERQCHMPCSQTAPTLNTVDNRGETALSKAAQKTQRNRRSAIRERRQYQCRNRISTEGIEFCCVWETQRHCQSIV